MKPRASIVLPRGFPRTIPLEALAAATAIAVAIALLSALAIDDAQAQVVAPAASAAASPLAGMLQGLVGLAVVVAFIFAAGWLMRKVGPRTRAGGLIHVVGGTSVGPREKVVVVRYDGRTLLLGVAPGRVSLLHSAEGALPADEAPAPSFVERLRSARGGA